MLFLKELNILFYTLLQTQIKKYNRKIIRNFKTLFQKPKNIKNKVKGRKKKKNVPFESLFKIKKFLKIFIAKRLFYFTTKIIKFCAIKKKYIREEKRKKKKKKKKVPFFKVYNKLKKIFFSKIQKKNNKKIRNLYYKQDFLKKKEPILLNWFFQQRYRSRINTFIQNFKKIKISFKKNFFKLPFNKVIKMFTKKIIKKVFPFFKKKKNLELNKLKLYQFKRYPYFFKSIVFLKSIHMQLKKKIFLRKYHKKFRLKKTNIFFKKLIFLKVKVAVINLIKKVSKFKKKMLKKFLIKIKIRIFRRKNFRKVTLRFKRRYQKWLINKPQKYKQKSRLHLIKRIKYKKKSFIKKKKKYYKKFKTFFYKKKKKFELLKKKLLQIKNKYFNRFFIFYKKVFKKKIHNRRGGEKNRNTKIFSLSIQQTKNNLFMQILDFKNLVLHATTLGFFVKHYNVFRKKKKENFSNLEIIKMTTKKAQPALKRRSITAKIFSIQRFLEMAAHVSSTVAYQFQATFINIPKTYAHVAFRNVLKQLNPKAFYWLLKIKYRKLKKKKKNSKKFKKEKEKIFSLTRLRLFHMLFTNTHNGTRSSHLRRV